jgi:peptidoglycan/LPS O-acetylase OafA/YrhL
MNAGKGDVVGGRGAEVGGEVRADAQDRLTSGYLHQVDVVRLLTFASVIAVHVVSNTTDESGVAARGVLVLLHFTRETFFVITGFVLFHSSYPRDGRTLDLPRFWRRRFLLIGVPYLAWSAIYWWFHGARGAGDLAVTLLTGSAEYHLYFLLVSMQVYLAFGLLVWLVRATRGHHGALLAAVTAYQVALFWLLHDVLPRWGGAPAWLAAAPVWAQKLLPSYLVYVVAGALAAVHLARVQGWVAAHGRLVAVGVVVAAVFTEGAYLLQLATGSPVYRAADVLQPDMIVWTAALTAGLLALGLRFAANRRPGLAASAVAEGARISFGVFLVHPLVITAVLASPLAGPLRRSGQPWTSVLVWLLVVLVSVPVVELVARTPLSLPLTGRRRPGRPRRTGAQRPHSGPPADSRHDGAPPGATPAEARTTGDGS